MEMAVVISEQAMMMMKIISPFDQVGLWAPSSGV
jgi:hypothetical protein